MFFYLSKLLGFFAIPSNLVILIGSVGLLLLPTRFARAGRWLAFVSLIFLAILGLSPIGNALLIPLEDRFPPWDAARGAPDGIIVLGGTIDAWGPHNERLVVVPELLRRYPTARILFSSGSGALMDDGDPEAKFAARWLENLGIARSRITLEDRSRNTLENAVFSKAIVQPKPGERWLLVTSAYHMPRAIGVFRKAGFPVEPYPVDWRTRGAEMRCVLLRPSGTGCGEPTLPSTNGSASQSIGSPDVARSCFQRRRKITAKSMLRSGAAAGISRRPDLGLDRRAKPDDDTPPRISLDRVAM
jgi:uncharacterized SAM-binding protein YcdF (DUF218 family)